MTITKHVVDFALCGCHALCLRRAEVELVYTRSFGGGGGGGYIGEV